MTVQGPEDPQVVSVAEQLAELLVHYTERLEEARSLLQKALEVSMVSVTLLCCRVLLIPEVAPEPFWVENFTVTLPCACLKASIGDG